MDILCCLDHTEVAMDKIIDDLNEAPFLIDLKTVENKGFCGKQCEFCEKDAEYLVKTEG